jgi:hypothetical protein
MSIETETIKTDDALVGTVIHGRYEVQELSLSDALGLLYKGFDNQTKNLVGIRVTTNPDSHRRLQEWLGEARLSRGRDAILAVGHIDRKRSFVVFCEAALEFLYLPDEEEDAHDNGSARKAANKSFLAILRDAWRRR